MYSPYYMCKKVLAEFVEKKFELFSKYLFLNTYKYNISRCLNPGIYGWHEPPVMHRLAEGQAY